MATWQHLAGDALEIKAATISQAHAKIDAYYSNASCPCRADGCDCITEGECVSNLTYVSADLDPQQTEILYAWNVYVTETRLVYAYNENDALRLADEGEFVEESKSIELAGIAPHDESDLGNCDTCNALYDLSSRDGRCGDCGECAEHCDHRPADPDWAVCQSCFAWFDLNTNGSCPSCTRES